MGYTTALEIWNRYVTLSSCKYPNNFEAIHALSKVCSFFDHSVPLQLVVLNGHAQAILVTWSSCFKHSPKWIYSHCIPVCYTVYSIVSRIHEALHQWPSLFFDLCKNMKIWAIRTWLCGRRLNFTVVRAALACVKLRSNALIIAFHAMYVVSVVSQNRTIKFEIINFKFNS